MAQITPNMTVAEILKMLGIDIDITDVDAVQGAMAAIQDILIARGDEKLLGLIKNQLPPGVIQQPTQSASDDPRLNKPASKGDKKQKSDGDTENGEGSGEDDDDDDDTPTRKNQNTEPKPLDPKEDPEVRRKSKIKRTADVVQGVINKINGTNDYNTPAAKADKEELEELLKQLTENPDMTLEELSDIEDQALDIAGRYTKIFRQDEPSRQARIKKIQDDAADPNTLRSIDAEDTANRRKAYQQKRPDISVKPHGAAKNFRSFDSFLQDLYRAIKAQIVKGEKPQDTWSKLPRRAQQGVLKRGEMAQEYNKEVPTIDFFLDCSASWSTDEQRYADDAISTIKQFEAQGKLHINLYYFGNNVTKDRSLVWSSGTAAWSHILETIEDDGSQNVVIITDSDMERQGTHSRNMTIPGYVWYLWRDSGGGAENAPRLPNELRGEIETAEYSFNIQVD
jgi:hypothetical protein